MSPAGAVEILPVPGVPEVPALPAPAVDLTALLLRAMSEAGMSLRDGDVLVVSSKIVSKAAGLTRDLAEDAAAAAAARDAVVRAETRRVLAERRTADGATRVVHATAGPVLAAAGVDASNVGARGGLLVLPPDPDADAHELALALSAPIAGEPARRIGVIVSDTAGRPWRQGQTDIAIGAAGVLVTDDHRDDVDADGRRLQVSVQALADTVAGAADLVKGKNRAVPVAIVRGLPDALVPGVGPGDDVPDGAASLVRTGPQDWFGLGRVEAVRAALGAPPGSPESERVGLPAVWPEPATDRLARVRTLTLLDRTCSQVAIDIREPDGEDGSSAEDADRGAMVHLRHADPFALGVARARFGVALASEGMGVQEENSEDAGLLRIRTVIID